MSAQWRLLTDYLSACGDTVTLSWADFDGIVGGVPLSATQHYPQWWHGDRPNTRAWRAAGFEAIRITPGESVTFVRQSSASATPSAVHPQRATDGHPSAAGLLPEVLTSVDHELCLVVIPCSARKLAGGRVGSAATADPELAAVRQRILTEEDSNGDESLVMPAWQRYDGSLYRAAQPTLAEVATSGRLLILSGGYGLLDGRDEIGTYNRIMRRGDWPKGMLERHLARRVAESGRDVVAFASNTTDYARVLRGTPWWLAPGHSAHLVTIKGVRGVSAVSRSLGEAVRAFVGGIDDYPTGTVVEKLAVSDRTEATDRFYAFLDELTERIGGRKLLSNPSLAKHCPRAGLYFFFEPGQLRPNGQPRVVRVGTHALTRSSRTTLWQRLAQHRGSLGGSNPGGGNHRGSIFRQHVGSAILRRRGEADLLASWTASRPSPESKDAERRLEVEVSTIIRAMPFLWLSVPTLEDGSSDRGLLERNSIALLSTLAGGDSVDASEWLGRDASSYKVRESALWNVNHVNDPFDASALSVLERYLESVERPSESQTARPA